MAHVMRMPEVLAGATEATIEAWMVGAGDSVTAGQVLAEVETDKALVELPAEEDGVVGRLLVDRGATVVVGDPIAVVRAAGEGEKDVAAALADAGMGGSDIAPTPDKSMPEVGGVAPSEVEPKAEALEVAEPSGSGTRRFVSPLVRRLAKRHEVDLDELVGTGPGGRVVRRDLDRYLTDRPAADLQVAEATTPAPTPTPAQQPGGSHYEDVPVDRMRKAIARRLTESKSTVPHFYLVADCRVDTLLALRAEVNAGASSKVSVNDLVVKAVAGALIDVPDANAIWNGDSIRRFSHADVAVAVATDGGLVTPVLRSVDRMSVSEVGTTVREMAERARAGRLKQHELDGGSFSVSNLGMYGTDEFSAILNPPQSGILAVGAARSAAVVDDGVVTVGTVMTVTLSVDHRVVDGALAAELLAAFRRRIEHPLTILV